MIKPNDVMRVARTGSTLLHNEGELTAAKVVRMTTAADWVGTLYHLRADAAEQIAAQFNRQYPDSRVAIDGSAAAPPSQRRQALAIAS